MDKIISLKFSSMMLPIRIYCILLILCINFIKIKLILYTIIL